MQPVLRCSYPMQYVLTLETADELLPEAQGSSPGERDSPERCRMLGYDKAPCPKRRAQKKSHSHSGRRTIEVACCM